MSCLRVLRLIVAALLLIASAHATPDKWTADIGQFTAADAGQPPPQGAELSVGSSSILLWATLAEDFRGHVTINRGFAGSELADSVFYADRIILPYRPRIVAVHAGENDLWADKSPEMVLADFQQFRTRIHATLPATKILYLSIKESPSRSRNREQVRSANRLIAADCASDPRCMFVDVATPLLDAAGGYRPELFGEDQLHLRPAGYAIWIRVIAPS